MLELSHKKLDVWKFSVDLVEEVYVLTRKFPREDLFGLTNQLRRASVSVSSNIAEGLSRSSLQEKHRFLEIARSSLVEVDTQLTIAIRLNYCANSDLEKINALLNSIFAMLISLNKKIKSNY